MRSVGSTQSDKAAVAAGYSACSMVADRGFATAWSELYHEFPGVGSRDRDKLWKMMSSSVA
jgi:hypothetical protein